MPVNRLIVAGAVFMVFSTVTKIMKKEGDIMENFHYEICNRCLIVYILKDLDHHEVTYLREKSDRLIDAGDVKNIVFDFENVDFMHSSGIGLIMGRYKKVLFIGGRAAVTNVGKSVDRIFKMSGLYKIIEKYDTPACAVEVLEGRRAL